MVGGGHLSKTPVDSIYSGVVSLKGIRTLLFLAELNKLECWVTDIGNAYLEAVTKEKVYIIAGPEFGEHVGGLSCIGRGPSCVCRGVYRVTQGDSTATTLIPDPLNVCDRSLP